jgi:hypothetical protein
MSIIDKNVRSASGVTSMLLAGLLVSACGGGGDGGGIGGPVGAASRSAEASAPVAADTGGAVPAEASSSKEAMLAWAKSLNASDTEEPMRTNTFRPPLDETTETSPG